MRKEDFTIDSYVHVVQRGTRGLPIVKDEIDQFRFLQMLTHFNDSFSPHSWYRDLVSAGVNTTLQRPFDWPRQEPLTRIICFCLVKNHFHLVLQEIKKGGVATFMKRLGIGMAKRFNERYKEQGSLFQGSYRAKLIADDTYFRYVCTYVQFKNALDVRPRRPSNKFSELYDWATCYPYSSLGDYTGHFDRPIIAKDFLSSLFTKNEYKEYCKDFLLGRHSVDKDLRAHQQGYFQ